MGLKFTIEGLHLAATAARSHSRTRWRGKGRARQESVALGHGCAALGQLAIAEMLQQLAADG
jgi:hypothetical protein